VNSLECHIDLIASDIRSFRANTITQIIEAMLCSDEISVIINFCDIRTIAYLAQVSNTMRSLVKLYFNINSYDTSGVIADIPHALDNLQSISCSKIIDVSSIRSINPIIHSRLVKEMKDQRHEYDIGILDNIFNTTGRLNKPRIPQELTVINALRMYSVEQLGRYQVDASQYHRYKDCRWDLLITTGVTDYDFIFDDRGEYSMLAETPEIFNHLQDTFKTQGSHRLSHRLKRHLMYSASTFRFYGDEYIRFMFSRLHHTSSVLWKDISVAFMRSDPITWMRLRDVTFDLDHTVSLRNMPEIETKISIRTRMRLFMVLSETLHLIPLKYHTSIRIARDIFSNLLEYVEDTTELDTILRALHNNVPGKFIRMMVLGCRS